MLLNYQENSDNLFSFKKYFIRIASLYICIVLVDIRNIYVMYFHCGPIHITENRWYILLSAIYVNTGKLSLKVTIICNKEN